MLVIWANQLAGRFNAPVYIVGSSLVRNDARDLDVIVIIPDDEFKNRYNISCHDVQLVRAQKYWEDMAKLGSWAHRNVVENIDFKVQDESYQDLFAGRKKLRIDTLNVPQEA